MKPRRTFITAILAIGIVGLALPLPPATGQDDAKQQQAELTMLRSALKTRADEIAQLKAENAKLAEQVKRLEGLCAKAGIATDQPTTAPAAKPPAAKVPATVPAAKPFMTLGTLLSCMQDATAENKTPLQRSAAIKALEGQDIQATLIIQLVKAAGRDRASIYARPPGNLKPDHGPAKRFYLYVTQADGLKLGTRGQGSFAGTIKRIQIDQCGWGTDSFLPSGFGPTKLSWQVQWTIYVDPAQVLP